MPQLRNEPFPDSFVNRYIKKRKRVIFEVAREEFHGEETEYIKVFDTQGTMLGQLHFASTKRELLVQTLAVEDWSAAAAVVERALRYLERVARRRKVKQLRAELYHSDSRVTDKIEALKQLGWRAQDVGKFAQRTSHILVKTLV